MPIKFSCSDCGKHLRAPDDAAGRKCRCPDCGTVATVPNDGQPSLHSPAANRTDSGHRAQRPNSESPAGVAEPTVLGLPKSAARIVGGIVGVGVIAIAAIAYYGYSSSQRRMERRNQLIQTVEEQIDAANDKAGEYDFVGAKDIFLAAAKAVDESPYADVYLFDELNGKIDTARNGLQRQENDYRAKIRGGWTMFEGEFVSGATKQRILAARQEDALQQKRAERRAARAKRLAEEYLAERERERQTQLQRDDEMWQLASDTSGATSLEDLAVLTVAYLQRFPDGAHADEAIDLQTRLIERLWMNRVLDLRDHWRQLYAAIVENQALIDQVLARSDAWMYQQKLEKLANINVEYQNKMDEVSESLAEIGAAGFAAADVGQTAEAITAFCRRNRDEPRFQQWRKDWIRSADPQAQLVKSETITERIPNTAEAERWSQSEQLWATAPFLESAEDMCRFLDEFPMGAHANEARVRIALCIEMDWSTQVFLKLRQVQADRKSADEYHNDVAGDRGAQKQAMERSEKHLADALELVSELEDMGFRGDLNGQLPHANSDLTELVQFFRRFRAPGKYGDWEERRLIDLFLSAIK
ncbi:MAG: hypothetical protein KKB50_17470 [Planctomycetes bacterium]|nr:hypothetical protein [Planctomycetota bacterium]